MPAPDTGLQALVQVIRVETCPRAARFAAVGKYEVNREFASFPRSSVITPPEVHHSVIARRNDEAISPQNVATRVGKIASLRSQ